VLSYNIVIEEGDYPEVVLPADTIIYLGDDITVEPYIFPDPSNLLLSWSENVPCIDCTSFEDQPLEDILYTLTAIDENGCSDSSSFLVKVNNSKIFQLPNVFSPNGDRNNDWFYMPYEKGIENINSFKIYDWNGALMFSTKNIKPGEENLGWNGTFQGKEALTGVYLYEVNLTTIGGKTIRMVGDVTLVR